VESMSLPKALTSLIKPLLKETVASLHQRRLTAYQLKVAPRLNNKKKEITLFV